MNKKYIEQEWKSFKTPIGICAIAWNKEGITQFSLPASSLRILKDKYQIPESTPPLWVKKIIDKSIKHLEGNLQDFSSTPLSLEACPPFHQKVYSSAIHIKAGDLVTYGALAQLLGNPQSSRAVGQALGRNPIALIIPCHRVMAAGGKLGGFSAHGGLETKVKMLKIEGVDLTNKKNNKTLSTSKEIENAIAYLKQSDKKISKVIKQIGPLDFTPKKEQSPYHSLFRAIVFQQLNGAAASTILERVKAIFPHKIIPTPQQLLATNDELLWKAGLSKAKAKYLKALAQATIDRIVPTAKKIEAMSDQEIIDQLTTIHGVGQWTVEMFLIFTLGRPDILPSGDFAIRKSIGQILELPEMPTPKETVELGLQWKPFRSVAALYLWRHLDQKPS